MGTAGRAQQLSLSVKRSDFRGKPSGGLSGQVGTEQVDIAVALYTYVFGKCSSRMSAESPDIMSFISSIQKNAHIVQ
jgi:hypothetical protein